MNSPASPRAFLGLDLGTLTGYAYQIGKARMQSGTWNHSPRKGAGEGARFLALWQRLEALNAQVGGFYAVGFERVDFVPKDANGNAMVSATQVWSGYHAIMLAWCELHGIHYLGVATATLKKFATSSGRATKTDMTRMFQLQTGRLPGDDNEADAFHALQWIQHTTRVGAPSK